MSWKRGRQDVQRLLDDGELEQVAPSPEVADRLLHDAEAHIRLASMGIEDDLAGALINQLGLRRNMTEYPGAGSPGVTP